MKMNKLISKIENNCSQQYSIKQVSELVLDVLHESGYNNIAGAVPIVTIAKQFGFGVYAVTSIKKNESGNIFIGGTTQDIYGVDKVIAVRDTENEFNKRFITAYELGHYLMYYVGNHEFFDNNKLFKITYYKYHKFDELSDVRAAQFALELLMPTERFKTQYMKAVEFSHNSKYVLAYLSCYFKVNQDVVDKRIKQIVYRFD